MEDFTSTPIKSNYQKVIHQGDDGKRYNGVGDVVQNFELKPENGLFTYNPDGTMATKVSGGKLIQFNYNTNQQITSVVYPTYTKNITYTLTGDIESVVVV